MGIPRDIQSLVRLLNKNSHLCSRLTQSTFKSLAARFEFSRPDGAIVRHLTAARGLAPNLPSSEKFAIHCGRGPTPGSRRTPMRSTTATAGQRIMASLVGLGPV